MCRGVLFWRAVSFAVLLIAIARAPANATFRFGPVQVSGNLSTQNLFRVPDLDEWSAVQQRNTFRLQYEHQLVEGGMFLKEFQIPLINDANFFAYYRFVYDSIFDIAPGGNLEAGDGSRAGRLSDIDDDARHDIAFENVLREVFLDFKMSGVPLSFRIGRQQFNWGEADSFRALDSVNPIDLTWHLQQEAGLIGKVGFDELRVPMWAIKALFRVGTLGPFSNTFIEAYDNPFDFQQSKIRFLPQSPWSVSVRNPFRQGLVLDLGQAATIPGIAGTPLEDLANAVTGGAVLVEPCFDTSGRQESNAAVGADFSRASQTGYCSSTVFPGTSLRQGLFDKHDPADVNQFGVRIGSSIFGVGFTANYVHRRHYFDIPTAGSAKARQGAVNSTPTNFLSLDVVDRGQPAHTASDPITREDTPVLGYIRIPIEFYMPYVDVFGLSGNYFEERTGAVLRAEATYTLGFPVSDHDHPNGIVKKDVMLAMVGFDRPTWITQLNRRSTFLISAQLFVNWINGHQHSLVGVPNSNLIPGQFRDENTIDEVKEFELLSTIIATTFYKGGSIVPVLAIIPQWSYMPTFGFLAAMDYYVTNNWILTPAIRIYTTPDGGTVDEPYGIGRLTRWDEIQLKVTYQF